MQSTHHASVNQLWATLLIEELVRRGVSHVCLAPGSRSTPLVLALAQRPELQLLHHFDERGLGFLALGIAKGLAADAADSPSVAIITTSGTAVANLYPAVIEAAQTGVALLVISADRPPRLQDCGANQAINQRGIFAAYPRHSLYLQPPSQEQTADLLLEQIATAIDAIADPAGGVTHINCMFDEPLYPNGTTEDFSEYLASVRPWLSSGLPYPIERPLPHTSDAAQPSINRWQQFTAQPGLIVVGALPDRDSANAVKALARALDWPLLADIQSQLKTDPDCLGLTDLLLSNEASRNPLLQSRHLLQLGSRLVSKRLQTFVDQHPWEQFWLVHPGDTPLAPGRNQSHFFSTAIGDWSQQQLATLEQLTDLPLHTESNRLLLAQQHRLSIQLQQQFSTDHHPQLSELAVAYQLLTHSPTESWLLAGNSLSIRLLDLIGAALPVSPQSFANHSGGSSDNLISPPLKRGRGSPQIFANRGASGIDGLVATALGCGLAQQQPGTLLLGDYSLLYDLNALALLREHPLPLVIVVLNNDGGGIFRMLPIPDETLRQQHYQRPHGLTFEHACTLFQIRYHHPVSLRDFIVHYQKALQSNGPCLIEISADARITAQQIQDLMTDQ